MRRRTGLEDLISELGDAIAGFDGKSPSILSVADVKFSGRKNYLDALIRLSADETGSVSSGATWLIKSTLERGATLSSGQADLIVETMPRITDWSAQLHICQTLNAIPVQKAHLPIVLDWLRPLTKHKRPFLRAWAMSAFHDLATQHSELLDEANDYLVRAQNDPAASVRARVRNITLA